MRKLVIRDRRGHVTMDLDTEEAVQELERLMNLGMVAVAVQGRSAMLVQAAEEEAVRKAEEVRVMYPLAGGRSVCCPQGVSTPC